MMGGGREAVQLQQYCKLDLKYGQNNKEFKGFYNLYFTYFPFRRGRYASEIAMLFVFVYFISIYNYFKDF
jgi:hypothetical protein